MTDATDKYKKLLAIARRIHHAEGFCLIGELELLHKHSAYDAVEDLCGALLDLHEFLLNE